MINNKLSIVKEDIQSLDRLKNILNIILNKTNDDIDKAVIFSILSIIEEYNEIDKKIDDIYEILSSDKIIEDNAITNLISEINRLAIIKYEIKDKITKNLMNIKKINLSNINQDNKTKSNIRFLVDNFNEI